MIENSNISNNLNSLGLHLKIVFFRNLTVCGYDNRVRKKTLYQNLKEKHSNKTIYRRDFNESCENSSNSSDTKLRKQWKKVTFQIRNNEVENKK